MKHRLNLNWVGNLPQVLVACCAMSLSTLASVEPIDTSAAEFEAMMQEVSNWGRWGDDDQLGTLNLITPDRRQHAATLVQAGTTISLARELSKEAGPWNPTPFQHQIMQAEMAGHQVSGDTYTIDVHGLAHTHLDGLLHFSHRGTHYNGVPRSAENTVGAGMLGIETIAVNGIFTRGVLVDLPRFMGVEYLEPGHMITAATIEAWEKHAGVTVGPGDALLIRTGRWSKLAKNGYWNYLQAAAGSPVSLARWLRQREVAVLGSDGVSDVIPSGVEGLAMPLHEVALVAMGMPVLDNLDLEALAAEAERLDRQTFLLVASPLRIRGGTGVPVNPLAIF